MNNFGKGFAAVIAGGITIGTAAIFMRLADVTPTAAAFWRVTLALPPLLLWLVLDNKSRQQARAHPKKPMIAGAALIGFWFAADLFLWHWSVEKTTVANATLLANMATIFTAIAGYVFWRQKFSSTFMVGLAFAILGAITLVGQTASVNPAYLIGDLLGLGTAIAYAGYIIYAAKVRGSLTTPMVMFGSALTTAIFLLPLALMEEGAFFPLETVNWLPLLGLAWLTHVLGQSLIIYGLAHVPATLGSVTLLIQPVFSALLAWWLFGEKLGLGHFIGASFIFVGITLAKRGTAKTNADSVKRKTT